MSAWDHVIVGAGSAGCVVASVLAATGLFAELGMHEHFHVVRMWRGPRPELAYDRVYAIGSLELG